MPDETDIETPDDAGTGGDDKMVPLSEVTKLRAKVRTLQADLREMESTHAAEIAEARARAAAAEQNATTLGAELESERTKLATIAAEREAERFDAQLKDAGITDPAVADFVKHHWNNHEPAEGEEAPEFGAWFESRLEEWAWLKPVVRPAEQQPNQPAAPPRTPPKLDAHTKRVEPTGNLTPEQIRSLPSGTGSNVWKQISGGG